LSFQLKHVTMVSENCLGNILIIAISVYKFAHHQGSTSTKAFFRVNSILPDR